MQKNSNIRLECINDINKAKEIWNEFSYKKNIYDDWDFRYCFYKYFEFPIRFYVAKLNGKAMGLIPLQYNTEKKYLEFFGGCFMEDNRIFMKHGYEEFMPELFDAIDCSARLEDVVGNDAFTKKMDIFEYKYIADLSGLKTLDEYLERTFKARNIKKLKKRFEKIESMSPIVVENRFEDIEIMMDLNVRRFKEESSFLKPFRREIFRDLLKLDIEFHMLSFIIGEKTEAVTFSFKYKDTFVGINAGVNLEEFPDLGTYAIMKKMDKAIFLKSKEYDAGIDDLGWKESWHFQKVPERIFIKK